MPAYKILYSNGSHYVTSMAKGVTLEQAKAYFVGVIQYPRTTPEGDEDLSSAVRVVGVEQIKGDE